MLQTTVRITYRTTGPNWPQLAPTGPNWTQVVASGGKLSGMAANTLHDKTIRAAIKAAAVAGKPGTINDGDGLSPFHYTHLCERRCSPSSRSPVLHKKEAD